MAPAAKPIPLRAEPPAAAGIPTLAGRVDAIDKGRLYGWAFDRGVPEARIRIVVSLGERPIIEAVADQNRPDLRRNGVGDGQHAFDLALPEEAANRARELVVVAISPSGEERVLHAPTVDEQAAEALIAAPLTRVLDKLDLLMAAQRHLQLQQRGIQTGERRDEAAPDAELARATGLQTEIGERLSDLEVHLMRFDGVLSALDERIDRLTRKKAGELRPSIVVLALLAGVILGAGVTLAAFL